MKHRQFIKTIAALYTLERIEILFSTLCLDVPGFDNDLSGSSFFFFFFALDTAKPRKFVRPVVVIDSGQDSTASFLTVPRTSGSLIKASICYRRSRSGCGTEIVIGDTFYWANGLTRKTRGFSVSRRLARNLIRPGTRKLSAD